MIGARSGGIPGLSWDRSGFVGLSGPLLALSDAIDRRFLGLAAAFSAEPQEFGPLLSVDDLRRVDYFSAFPHVVTFPACAARDDAALRRFAEANRAGADGPLRVDATAAIQCVLAPAACYGVYIGLQGEDIAEPPRVVTVRGTCFRSEAEFVPLLRQPSFSMREIVHLGDTGSVARFLEEARQKVTAVAQEWDLPVSVQVATDPFFDPARSPKYLHARLFPSKHELLQDGLAIASFNNHRNFIGEAFRITSAHEHVHTACVAFGIERWVGAILRRHGSDPAGWPVQTDRLPR
jgi:seryl-tRNA synthetase